jgi:hypothetical protein
MTCFSKPRMLVMKVATPRPSWWKEEVGCRERKRVSAPSVSSFIIRSAAAMACSTSLSSAVVALEVWAGSVDIGDFNGGAFGVEEEPLSQERIAVIVRVGVWWVIGGYDVSVRYKCRVDQKSAVR